MNLSCVIHQNWIHLNQEHNATAPSEKSQEWSRCKNSKDPPPPPKKLKQTQGNKPYSHREVIPF